MSKESYFIETSNDNRKFRFVCEGCGAEGELEIPTDCRRFTCPEDCGAVYIPWLDNGQPKLMCVVKPIFVDDEDDEDGADECAYCDEWERCTCYD